MNEIPHESPPMVEWTGKDGKVVEGAVLTDYKFFNARYICGQILRVDGKMLWGNDENGKATEVERLYFLAIEKSEVQTFLVGNEMELLCLSAALTGAVAKVSATWGEKKEYHGRAA
jgi:hypothetical protein